MSIQPHDVRELLGKQSGTAPVSDEQVDRMVTVLNSHRATRRARLRPDDASAAGSTPVGHRPTAAPERR